MGCLFEFIFEVVFTGLFHLLLEGYIAISFLIIPRDGISKARENKIRKTLTGFFAILLLFVLFGVIFMLPNMPVLNIVGKYMTFVSLSIIGLQILIGIVAAAVRAIKKRL